VVTAGRSALVLALVDRATGEVAPHQPFGARDHNGPGRTGPVPDGVPFPAGDSCPVSDRHPHIRSGLAFLPTRLFPSQLSTHGRWQGPDLLFMIMDALLGDLLQDLRDAGVELLPWADIANEVKDSVMAVAYAPAPGG
jgi:hypothetical protein